MLALTLTQPWAFAVRHLGKDVENRNWAPPESLVGQRFCIHAGKLNEESPARVWEEVFATIEGLVEDGLTALWPTDKDFSGTDLMAQSGAIVTVVTLDRVSRAGSNDPAERSPWRAQDSRYGWVLRDVVAIEPVPCKGAQSLWRVPDDIAAQVKANYERATHDTPRPA